MRRLVIVLGLMLSGCTYAANVAPSSSAAGDILPQRKISRTASFFIDPGLASLNREASVGYSCGAHEFPINAGPAIASSIRSVNESAFDQITEGGSVNHGIEGVERHLVYQLDSFQPRLHYEAGFWEATAVANVELVLKVTAYDAAENAMLRTRVTGTGFGEVDGGCESGAEALSIATNQAIKRAMEGYVDRVINAGQI